MKHEILEKCDSCSHFPANVFVEFPSCYCYSTFLFFDGILGLFCVWQANWSQGHCVWMRPTMWLWTRVYQPYISARDEVQTWGIRVIVVKFELCGFIFFSLYQYTFNTPDPCVYFNRYFVLQRRGGLSGLGILYLLVLPFVNTQGYLWEQMR